MKQRSCRNPPQMFAALAALFLSSASLAESVRIGTKDVELTFDSGFAGPVETNRIVAEMNRFFASGNGFDDFFDIVGLSDGESVQLNPGRGGGGPEVEEAADIRYFAGNGERIALGTNTLAWIAGVFAQAAPYTNTLGQAESLLASLSSGSLTNDMQTARTAFVINGTILVSTSRDEEIRHGIESYWGRLHYHPLSLLDWKMGRFTQDGPVLPSIRFKFVDVDVNRRQVDSDLLVYLDGRWRIALFE